MRSFDSHFEISPLKSFFQKPYQNIFNLRFKAFSFTDVLIDYNLEY